MTRRLLVPCLALLLAVPLGAQVGYPPEKSPYEDLLGKQAVTYGVGLFVPGGDPAGVGPGNAIMVSGRYELKLSNALWLNTRLGYVPSAMRVVKDPLFSDALRIYGAQIDQYVIGDASFGVNLTGNKSWRRVVPQVHGGFGFISTLGEEYDLGAYRFGTKFQLNYGLSARIVTRGAWEVQADLTHMFWKYKYPADYAGDGGTTDTSILGDRSTSPWKGNAILTFGVSRFFFR